MTSKAHLEGHLLSDHCSDYSNDQVSALADTSTTILTSNMEGICPLCLQEKANLRNHLSKHMQTLALFVLPNAGLEDREDIDSNEAVVTGSEKDASSSSQSSSSTSDPSSKVKEIVIAVFGVTASGKSTFIDKVAESDTGIGAIFRHRKSFDHLLSYSD